MYIRRLGGFTHDTYSLGYFIGRLTIAQQRLAYTAHQSAMDVH